MIELYVLSTLAAMGYLLNKSSQTVNSKSELLNVHDIPSQSSIYTSKHFEEVKRKEERAAAKAFALSKQPTKTNVISKNFALNEEGTLANTKRVKSLTGDFISAEKFTHNNMVPFFGGNVKQNMNEHSTKSILENYTGVGDTFKNKKEVECMYDKAKDFTNVNGMANQDDFYRERMVQSRTMNNVAPIPQVRVGPGLNQGYNATPAGGFQQFDAQDIAMSQYKSVDELRVATKPKMTYEARVVDGKKGELRAEVPNLVKNRVETFFEQTPDMLLKTTGAYTKAAEIPEFNVPVTNRVAQTRETIGIATLKTMGTGDADDFGKSKILVYNNERDITTTRVYQGNVQALVKSIVAPIADVLRVSKKEHAVDNPRHFGNMNAQMPEKPTMYDPNDIARTTIKETLIHDEMGMGTVTGPKKLVVYDPDEVAKVTGRQTLDRIDYELNMAPVGQHKSIVYDPDDVAKTTMKETTIEDNHGGNIDRLDGMGMYVNDYMARNTQKQFISDKDYIGTAGSAYTKKEMSKTDMNNAIITANKEITLYGREPTKEGKKVANGSECVSLGVKKVECDIASNRVTHNADRLPSQIVSYTDFNLTRDRSMQNTPDDRLDPALLKPFVDNPYTQSLTSAF